MKPRLTYLLSTILLLFCESIWAQSNCEIYNTEEIKGTYVRLVNQFESHKPDSIFFSFGVGDIKTVDEMFGWSKQCGYRFKVVDQAAKRELTSTIGIWLPIANLDFEQILRLVDKVIAIKESLGITDCGAVGFVPHKK